MRFHPFPFPNSFLDQLVEKNFLEPVEKKLRGEDRLIPSFTLLSQQTYLEENKRLVGLEYGSFLLLISAAKRK